MLTFVLYDDEQKFREKSEKIINKVVKPLNLKYEIIHFEKYDEEFEQFIADDRNQKVYIMDIQVPDSISGIEVAKKVRKNDFESIIIMITSHTELGYEALKAQIMLLDFISKYHNWEENLMKTIKRAVRQTEYKKILVFDSDGVTRRVYTEDVLYILKTATDKTCCIKTTYNTMIIHKSMAEIGKMLDSRFYLTHRSCYANLDNVREIKWKENTIVFTTGEEIDYIARERKKGLREYVRNR